MRIAVLAPPWIAVPPRSYGGTEQVVDSLCRGLRDAGHDVLLVATGESECAVEQHAVFDHGVGPEAADPVRALRQGIDGHDAAAAWGADIVHDHTLCGPFYGAVRGSGPVVATAHGPFVSHLGAIYAAIAELVPLVAISHAHAASAVPTPIAAVIHHGVDTEQFTWGPGDGGYALFLGRMIPEKGVAEAIHAARRAGVPLRIAAKMREPAERDYFAARVEPALGGDVEYVGEVGNDDKVDLLRGATCLLNPIRWPEPFGMVMVEALACGTPVVAPRCASVPELVDDGVTGFVCATDAHLAPAVLAATGLDRRACRRAAEERFSIARMTADHVALYERVMERSRPGDADAA